VKVRPSKEAARTRAGEDGPAEDQAEAKEPAKDDNTDPASSNDRAMKGSGKAHVTPVLVEQMRSKALVRITSRKRLLLVFQKLDIDHSGRLSRRKFRKLLTVLSGTKIPPNECATVWDALRGSQARDQEDELDALSVARWLGLQPEGL
jgi:hypothetical protein